MRSKDRVKIVPPSCQLEQLELRQDAWASVPSVGVLSRG